MPIISTVTFSEMLTNVSIQFQPTQGEYLADWAAPPVPVAMETATFWSYDKSTMDTPDSLRAPRSAYNRVDWTVSTDTYQCEEYGLEGEIDDRERKNAVNPLDLDIDTTEIVTDMILNNREKRVADILTATGTITQNTTLSGTSQWSDNTTGVSDPIGDIKTGRTTIYDSTGYTPNRLLLGYHVFEALKSHPDIMARVQFSQLGVVTTDLLAQIFEVEEVKVAGVRRRSSTENATDAFTDTWGKNAILMYSEARPGLKRASLMYQMRAQDLQTFRYREDNKTIDVVRVSEIADEKVVSAALGYLVVAASA